MFISIDELKHALTVSYMFQLMWLLFAIVNLSIFPRPFNLCVEDNCQN